MALGATGGVAVGVEDAVGIAGIVAVATGAATVAVGAAVVAVGSGVMAATLL